MKWLVPAFAAGSLALMVASKRRALSSWTIPIMWQDDAGIACWVTFYLYNQGFFGLWSFHSFWFGITDGWWIDGLMSSSLAGPPWLNNWCFIPQLNFPTLLADGLHWAGLYWKVLTSSVGTLLVWWCLVTRQQTHVGSWCFVINSDCPISCIVHMWLGVLKSTS